MAYGEVSVGVDGGRLRLRWRVSRADPRRRTMALGLKDDREEGSMNYYRAKEVANWIETDIRNGVFDPTLGRYRNSKRGRSLSLGEVFDQYLAYKSKTVLPRTIEKYRGLGKHLKVMGLSGTAAHTPPDRALTFAHRLRKRLSATTCREYLSILGSVWEWGRVKGFLQNPWKPARATIKGGRVRKAEHFSDEEVGKILAWLQGDSRMQIYMPFAAFLFATGTRIGEAKALLWSDISPDGRVSINKTQTRDNVVLPTKNHKHRAFPLPPALLELLMAIKERRGADPNDHVFITNRGNSIDDHSWNRTWKTILNGVGIENYRRPYAA